MRSTANFAFHAILAAALAAFATSSAAAADAYLKLGDIKGEHAAHHDKKIGDDWIQIDSYQWGATRDVQSAGAMTGKRLHEPITVTKEMDKATPKLAESALAAPPDTGSMTLRGRVQGCAVGTSYPSATLKTGDYSYEFKDVIITSCAASGSGGGGGSALPTEEISFNYSRIQLVPIKQDRKDSDKPYRPKWDTPKPVKN